MCTITNELHTILIIAIEVIMHCIHTHKTFDCIIKLHIKTICLNTCNNTFCFFI